ncbi:endonuclease/exonuclease/phosphatase family protein [Rhodovulum sp. 12E13]|uniref:endonuclease/exonuclease/phosphatase family protein n=1 Tax=Rhodovulum sp. 12E13 TaxID=2203891 RepID=UPI001F2A5D1F|nr:endonuclease/exonuclease/phosphatase family protein [Rhodovulum sp. 12E13]
MAQAAAATELRLATWHVELSRDGPGLLLQDIAAGDDPQVAAVLAVLEETRPDILLLTGIDVDPGGATLSALQDALEAAGTPFPHAFAPASNAGLPSGADLDGDGRTGEARDAQGYGRFRGDGAMALLSRYPVDAGGVRDFTALRWRDLPGATLPVTPEGDPFPSAAAQAVQRLSSAGHWAVPVLLPGGRRLTILAFAATPPVFDGPEDRNGLRAADETRLWLRMLDGAVGPPPEPPFAVLGRANVDPVDGEGVHAAVRALLADPRLQDPAPRSAGGAAAADRAHRGDPALDTAEYDGPGNLRVDYVLPSADLRVTGAGVHWPEGTAETVRAASRGRIVWVDVALPPPQPPDGAQLDPAGGPR